MLMAIIEYGLNPGAEEEFGGFIETLEPELAAIDGFLAADPARSLREEGVLYEISWWRDAAALAAWSDHALHREAKIAGRERLLKWYRIRIAEVTRDWQFGAVPANHAD